jgi:sugar transferase (PEP-CTERM/EpsH1 system associated)
MKILMISHCVPFPPHSGALLRIYNLLKEVGNRHEVHLLSFTQRVLMPTEAELRAAVRELERHCRSIRVFPVHTDRSRLAWYSLLAANAFSGDPYDYWRFSSHEMREAVQRAAREIRPDLVHAECISVAPYALALALPRVLVHHNVESSLLFRRADNDSNPLAKRYIRLQASKLRRAEQRATPLFDVNVCVSELDREEFIRFCPGASFLAVPNGTDVNYFAPREEPTGAQIVFVGGLSWYPNTDGVLHFIREVLPLVRRRVPNASFVVIGGSPGRELKQIAAAESGVRVLGRVEDIRDEVARSAVFVVPLRVGGGTRLKILDAMAMGKAIVSTSIGAEGLDVQPGVDIVIADTPQDFATAVARLIRDPERRHAIAASARAHVMERYSWQRIAPLQEAAYEQAVREFDKKRVAPRTGGDSNAKG